MDAWDLQNRHQASLAAWSTGLCSKFLDCTRSLHTHLLVRLATPVFAGVFAASAELCREISLIFPISAVCRLPAAAVGQWHHHPFWQQQLPVSSGATCQPSQLLR